MYKLVAITSPISNIFYVKLTYPDLHSAFLYIRYPEPEYSCVDKRDMTGLPAQLVCVPYIVTHATATAVWQAAPHV